MSCDALYARQSVDRADSISIESQLEYCRYETHGNPYREYADRGYSGKNTQRPAFERLLSDIKAGAVSRVIVYKLDRISRSILDFSSMMDTFQKYGVEFVSSTEKFDTSTPIGRAMLNICIVFAQLERETIQKRVADSYYARSRRGFYMGGRVPYGYTRIKTVVDGINTSMYIPVDAEAEQIRLMYSLYAHSDSSLGDIVRCLEQRGMKHLRGGTWTTPRISDILRNPVYVRADADVYDFFTSQGVSVVNPISDFTARFGCYLYSTPSQTNKHGSLAGRELVLAPHEGIVSSSNWLKCRRRCMSNRCFTRTSKPVVSFLCGKVKCGKCGYGLTVVKSNTKYGRYLVCSCALSTKKAGCTGVGGTVYADVLERYVNEAVSVRLGDFCTLVRRGEEDFPRLNENKIRLNELNRQIDALLSGAADAGGVLARYINDRAAALDAEIKRISDENRALLSVPSPSARVISAPASLWADASFEAKRKIVDVLIDVITVADGIIDITWKV